MKPRKSLRKIVNSLIGKKPKSALKEHEAVIEDHIAGKSTQSRRHHGSADDLLTENATTNGHPSNHSRSKRKTRSQSLPRRSRSSNNFRSLAPSQHKATCNEVDDDVSRVKNSRFCSSKSESKDIKQFDHREELVKPNSLRRRQSEDSIKFRDAGTIQRTTSLNIGRFETKGNDRSRICGSDRDSIDRNASKGRSRLDEPHSLRRTCSAIVSHTSREETEEKLKTCRSVLDRLTAQVKEIKVASQHLDSNEQIGTIEKTDPKRDLRELDLSNGASRRLKAAKYNTHDTSSNSSGYYSENSNNDNSSTLAAKHWQKDSSVVTHQGNNPKSAHHNHRRPQVTREDSNSSGYATGSGSEDDRQESPNGTDRDSAVSSFMVPNGQYHHQSRQALTLAWKNQHFNHANQPIYDSPIWYDPHCMYYHEYDKGNESIYQTYGELYSYAPSSVYEDEVLNSGWYQIQPVDSCSSEQYSKGSTLSGGNIRNSYWGYSSNTVNTKYGGLSDLFFDPTARPDVSLMESIANEVAMTSGNEDNTNFKTYGSFRYRNGQRTVTAPGNPRRKMVRFSQTVHQRVETEESEMEDSTSVIKDCEDDASDATTVQFQNSELADSEMIYAHPQHYSMSSASHRYSQNQQNYMPEPIYEFPSGHIESSCMCEDCILARGSCQMQPTQAVSFF